MPVHDGSRSDQDERLPRPGPERSQHNPEQLVHGSQSAARSLGVQSQQLLIKSQVFKDEVLTGTESADQPAEEMSDRSDHSRNHIGKVRIELCAKSFICRCPTFCEAQQRTRSELTINGIRLADYQLEDSLTGLGPIGIVHYAYFLDSVTKQWRTLQRHRNVQR
jgi:hypothetical protein